MVSNVRSVQRAGTQLVDIDYDLADPDSATLAVIVAVSTNLASRETNGAVSNKSGKTRESMKRIEPNITIRKERT